MEKLLNAIASRLTIRSVNEERKTTTVNSPITVTIHPFGYEERMNSIRERFKKELNEHIFRKLQKRKTGGYVDYMFECGKHRPLGYIMDEANDNLAEVLQKLPVLQNGERYVLPANTYFSFILLKKDENEVEVKVEILSKWIKETYLSQ